MIDQSIVMTPIAHVVGGRLSQTDDLWGENTSILRLDGALFDVEVAAGLSDFSHLEIVFYDHPTDRTSLDLDARRTRDNIPDRPAAGASGQRTTLRINSLGVSRCRLLRVDGLDLHVEDLTAVDGRPVLDIKPCSAESAPQDAV